eukprot:1415250-Amphidinium_carterae.1
MTVAFTYAWNCNWKSVCQDATFQPTLPRNTSVCACLTGLASIATADVSATDMSIPAAPAEDFDDGAPACRI